MSRQTVTLTAPNGAKVRTVRSRQFFVVAYETKTMKYTSGQGWADIDPTPVAYVVKRTDSPMAAWAVLRKHPRSHVVFEVTAGVSEMLTATQVEALAANEKGRKAALNRRG